MNTLKKYGANLLKPKKVQIPLKSLFSQFKSPIILILLFAAGLSYFLGDVTDTVIIITIILISSLLGFWQEKGAADCLILESKGLFVNEATLTGETYPVEKSTKTLNVETPLAKLTNSLWMGTSVESGSGKALAITTGQKNRVWEDIRRVKNQCSRNRV